VYTPGYRNRFGHPRPEIVARYATAGIRSYRTDYDGALIFTFGDGGSLTPSLERERERRYWRDPPVHAALTPLE
jgi:competence protein ComEC